MAHHVIGDERLPSSRPRANWSNSRVFFKQTTTQKSDFSLVYEADIAENERQARKFPDGGKILNEMRIMWNLSPSVLSRMIPLLSVNTSTLLS